jgi:hypothetical protein
VIAAPRTASTASGWRLAVQSDSPSPSWYEPDASWDDDDRPEASPEPEPWVVTHGWATWTHCTDTDD